MYIVKKEMVLHHLRKLAHLQTQEQLFDWVTKVSYVVFVVSALGLAQCKPAYLATFDFYVRLYICLFLLWRFNPLRKTYTFTSLDRKISFSAGLFMLTTSILHFSA